VTTDTLPKAEEGELLRDCLEGHSAAWEEFVRRYHAHIEGAVRFTFLRSIYFVPEADVDNVVQDLYARLYEDDYRRLRSFQGRCPLRLWLKSLAVRHALNTIRAEKLRGRFGGGALDELPLRRSETTEEPEEREDVARLDVLIDQLPPLQKTAVKMFYFDGLAYRQIAAALGMPIQTVGSLISRARERLRRAMPGRGE
jgi:RNA polymerase sigma-70 factor (ECF subfamily)